MFVKPRRAFVGNPSVVASSSGRAKYARYARLFPSTRKRSASRAGASSSWSSAPVSVFGMPPASLFRGLTGAACAGPRRRPCLSRNRHDARATRAPRVSTLESGWRHGVAPRPRLLNAQVGLLDLLVLGERIRLVRQGDVAGLHDVAPV